MEIWKDVYGYEGRYEVSNYGNVRTKNKQNYNKIIHQIDNHGYRVVVLWKNGKKKRKFVHIVVMEAFDFRERKGGYDKNLVVDHIDFNRSNNRLENLQWLTQAENLLRSTSNPHIGRPCIDITTGKKYKSMADARRDIGAPTNTSIKMVCDGERPHYKKHIFRYLVNGECVEPVIKQKDRKKREYKPKYPFTGKRVLCIDTGEIFNSCLEAEKAFGFGKSTVSRVAKGTRKSISGYRFKYYDA